MDFVANGVVAAIATTRVSVPYIDFATTTTAAAATAIVVAATVAIAIASITTAIAIIVAVVAKAHPSLMVALHQH